MRIYMYGIYFIMQIYGVRIYDMITVAAACTYEPPDNFYEHQKVFTILQPILTFDVFGIYLPG